MDLSIPIKAVGKERPRFHPQFKYAYTPKKTKDFEATIAAYFSVYMRNNSLKTIEGYVRADTIFYIKIPKSWPKKKKKEALDGKIRPATTPDADNQLKSLYDGLNNVAYVDDKQIVEGSFSKLYHGRNNPREESVQNC